MVEVKVFAEGQTEEIFIKQVVAPALRHLQIYLKPILLNTSKAAKGGAFSFDRLKFNAKNTLLQNPDTVLSTFIDLYALDSDFPDFQIAQEKNTVYEKVAHLECALQQAIIAHVGCRPERFIPHIQPYEFEALLFSDVTNLSLTEPEWAGSLAKLISIRNSASSPEHINNGFETKPSKRLEDTLRPRYKKTLHGPRAAQKITLDVIERECVHFKSWMDKLRKLAS